MSMQDIIQKEAEARKSGLHYGVYTSIQKPEIKLGKDNPCTTTNKCQVCGAPLYGNQMKYCSPNCREKHRRANWMGDKYV